MRTGTDRRSLLSGMLSLAAFAAGSEPAGVVAADPRSVAGDGRSASRGVHPFVFSTASDMRRVLACGSATAAVAKRLAETRCRTALDKAAAHASPFSGCSLSRYLNDLTDEQRGAAQAAASLALYAYLHRLSASTYGDGELAARARKAAKLILLSWAKEGLRERGAFRAALAQYCDEKGEVTLDTEFAIGLHLGRGVPYLVHATDLMLGMGEFEDGERVVLDEFFRELSALIRLAGNSRARRSNLDCNRFSNHVSVQLAALVSIARFRHDHDGLADAGFRQGGQVAIPWTLQVSQAIYGPGQTALNCYRNGSQQDFAQTQTPVAGEVVDRFRAGAAQTFGYPMFSLTHLLLSAKVLMASEFRALTAVIGACSRLLSALTYYSAYFAQLLSPDETRVPGDFRHPGSEQYVGKIVSRSGGTTIDGRDGLLLPYLLGSSLFAGDQAIRAVFRRADHFIPQHLPFSAVSSLYVTDVCP